MRFFAAAGLVMVLSGLGAYYATDQLSFFSIANLVLGPLVLLAAGVAQSRRVQGFRGTRSRRMVWRWALRIAAVTGVVVAANALAGLSSLRLDLTRGGQYTLAEQSLAVCSEVGAAEEPLALLFFEDALLADDVRLLVEAYESRCPVGVQRMRAKDAPPAARDILRSYETSIVACLRQRCEPVGFPSESNVTNAMLRLVRSRAPRVYFMVGHGEGDAAVSAPTGYSGLTGSLRDEGIEVSAWVSLTATEVPADASLLVTIAPERDLLAAEIEAVDRYLLGGGRLLAFVEPGVESNLHELLARWGFDLPRGVLADPAGSPLLEEPAATAIVAGAFDSYHPVTRKLGPRNMVLLPSARAVVPARKPEPQDRLVPIVWSGAQSWLESDVEAALGGRRIERDPDEASRPLPVVSAGSYPRAGAEARIVVFGDRDLASNRLLGSLYDRDLVLFAVLWLVEDESRIALRPKWWRVDDDPLTIQQTLAYFYFMAFALPELLLLLGIHAWYRQQG